MVKACPFSFSSLSFLIIFLSLLTSWGDRGSKVIFFPFLKKMYWLLWPSCKVYLSNCHGLLVRYVWLPWEQHHIARKAQKQGKLNSKEEKFETKLLTRLKQWKALLRTLWKAFEQAKIIPQIMHTPWKIITKSKHGTNLPISPKIQV